MKRKTFLTAVLALAMSASTALFAGCGLLEKLQQPSEMEQVYAQYVVYVQAQGQTPLSYEEWLATIKGEKGDKGITPQLRINENTNEWEVSYDNGTTWTSLGVKATADSTYASKLQFQRIPGKDEYCVAGIGLEEECEIIIPSTHKGLPVTEIAKDALSICVRLTSVVIPDSVTTIGWYAFQYNSALTSVVIGDNVATIGNYAFYYCNSLTSVVIGDNVTTIGDATFSGCIGLASVYYKGTASEWADISIGSSNTYFTNATRYYYIENQADVPTDGGNYWHYDENDEIAIWV